MATDYLVSIVTKATDGITPEMQKQGAAVDKFIQTVNSAGKTAQSSLDPVANGVARVGTEAQKAAVQVERLQDAIRKPGTLTPTIPAGRNDEFERRIQELKALANSISGIVLSPKGLTEMMRNIGGAQTFKDIDRIGEKLGLLQQKSELLGRLGGRGMKEFRDQVLKASTTKELEQIEKQIEKTGKTAEQSKGGLHGFVEKLKELATQKLGGSALGQGIIGGLVGGAAVAVIDMAVKALHHLGEAVQHTIERVKELATEQRKLGIESIETGISVHGLETLRTAAKLTGVEIGTLQFGMRRMAQLVVDQPEVFEKMGIAVRDATGAFLPMEQIFHQFSDLIAKTSDRTLQMAATTTVMGRSGTRMLPVLQMGSKGFHDMGEAGLRAGVIMDHLSDRALVNLANQVARTDLQWEGLKNRMSVALIPLVSLMTAGFERLALTLHPVASLLQAMSLGLVQLAPGLGFVAGNMKGLGDQTKHAAGMLTVHGVEASRANQKLLELINSIRNGPNEAEKFDQRMKSLIGSFKQLDPTAREIDKIALSFRGAEAEIRLLGKSFDDNVIGKINQRAPIVQAAANVFGSSWEAALAALGGSFDQFGARVEDIFARIAQPRQTGLKEEFSEVTARVEAMRDALLRANVLPGMQDALKNIKAEIDAATDVAGKLGAALRGAMAITDWEAALKRANQELARGALSLETWRMLTAEIEAQVRKIGDTKIDLKPKEFKLPNLKPSDKVIVVELQVMPDDKLSPFVEDIREGLRDIGKDAFVMKDIVVDAARGMAGAITSFYDDLIDKAISTSTLWGKIWNSMAKAAIAELAKIIASKFWASILDFFSTLFQVASKSVGSVVGEGGGGTQRPDPGATHRPPGVRAVPTPTPRPSQVTASLPVAVTRALTAFATRPQPRPMVPVVARMTAPSINLGLSRSLRGIEDAIDSASAGRARDERGTFDQSQPQTMQQPVAAPIDQRQTQNFYVNAIDTRSVLEDLLGMRGSLRRANQRIAELREA